MWNWPSHADKFETGSRHSAPSIGNALYLHERACYERARHGFATAECARFARGNSWSGTAKTQENAGFVFYIMSFWHKHDWQKLTLHQVWLRWTRQWLSQRTHPHYEWTTTTFHRVARRGNELLHRMWWNVDFRQLILLQDNLFHAIDSKYANHNTEYTLKSNTGQEYTGKSAFPLTVFNLVLGRSTTGILWVVSNENKQL